MRQQACSRSTYSGDGRGWSRGTKWPGGSGSPASWVKREQEAGRLPFAHRLGARKWTYNDAELDAYIAALGSRP